MQYNLTTSEAAQQASDCVIVGVFENQLLTPAAQNIDAASGGAIKKILTQQDLTGKIEQTLLLYDLPNVKATRVLLVGCGDQSALNENQYIKATTAAMMFFKNKGSKQVSNYLTELNIPKRDIIWNIKQAIDCCEKAYYVFDQLKSVKAPPTMLEQLTLAITSNADKNKCEQALQQGIAIGKGKQFLKNLANTPANICTPTYMAEQALDMAKQYSKVKTTILEKKDMETLGMGALLAVSKGSAQPPKFIIVEYNGAQSDTPPIMLIGKGITFDTGGISIKPSAALDEMKFDMCGGATVLGTLKAVAELGLPLRVIGIVAASENMPGGNATKPGDIVTTLSGQTVEILDTDAEGRLVLCDALAYSERYNPALVIDMATLTGAATIALGTHASIVLSKDELLVQDLLNASNQSYDRAWQLPLWDDYQSEFDSNFADFANIGNTRAAGTIKAACFLERFTKNFRWAHMDIAATAYVSGKEKGATGRPLSMLVQFLLNQCK